jgi:hypothetical protein
MASHPGTRQRATPAGATPCSANEASLVDALNEQGKFASIRDLRKCKAKCLHAVSVRALLEAPMLASAASFDELQAMGVDAPKSERDAFEQGVLELLKQ